MHWFCFRVAEISFFALHYKSTTKLIFHGKLFDVPRFDNIRCDSDKSWLKCGLKEQDPNKLETHNLDPIFEKIPNLMVPSWC